MGNSVAQETKPQTEKEIEPPQVAVEATKLGDQPLFDHVHKMPEKKPRSKVACCKWCCDAIFVILNIVTLLKALGEICVAVSGAISIRLFSTEQSSKMVGMVLLALLAAVTVSLLIYSLIAVFKKQEKPLHAAALGLILVAILQAVVLGVAVRHSAHDQEVLELSMRESFDLNREDNPRHVHLWAATQFDLNCCGLNGPYDYQVPNLPDVFPPNVPISCCPSYDPSRSELVQERDRQTCKLKRTYYAEGCKEAIFEVIKTNSDLVLGFTISLMILEVIMSILSGIQQKRIKKSKELEKADRQP